MRSWWLPTKLAIAEKLVIADKAGDCRQSWRLLKKLVIAEKLVRDLLVRKAAAR